MQETLEYIKQAFDLKSQKCYKQAIEMLYKALEEESDNIEILFQLGELYFLLNNFQRAASYLEKVLVKNEKHIEALKILEKIYMFSNDYTNAYETAEKVFNIEKNTQNLLELIHISSVTGDLDKIKKFECSDIINDEILYGISKAYYDNEKPDEAKIKLNETLELNPENEDALVLLGKIYFDENEFEKSKNKC